jgi:hypothetical protein
MTVKAFHPLAEMLPLIQGAEFDRLVADIREQGLLSPANELPRHGIVVSAV